MLILFDHGAPRGLARGLLGHKVIPAKAMGWEQLANGELLQAAEGAQFELFFTTDQRIRYQQNLAGRKIAIVVLTGTTKWSQSYTEVFIPLARKPFRPELPTQ
jgi:hypothetical protein